MWRPRNLLWGRVRRTVNSWHCRIRQHIELHAPDEWCLRYSIGSYATALLAIVMLFISMISSTPIKSIPGKAGPRNDLWVKSLASGIEPVTSLACNNTGERIVTQPMALTRQTQKTTRRHIAENYSATWILKKNLLFSVQCKRRWPQDADHNVNHSF